MSTTCPCGSQSPYEQCCGRWHHGAQRLQAPDAQALMRSRYSAFVLDLHDYLLETWHPTTRPATLEHNPPDVKWLGLEIKKFSQQDNDHATVEFVARHKLAGRAIRMHEISRFIRQNEKWLYVDGEFVNKQKAKQGA